jgi:hypothetical protein
MFIRYCFAGVIVPGTAPLVLGEAVRGMRFVKIRRA